jgi:hypothetical protein
LYILIFMFLDSIRKDKNSGLNGSKQLLTCQGIPSAHQKSSSLQRPQKPD